MSTSARPVPLIFPVLAVTLTVAVLVAAVVTQTQKAGRPAGTVPPALSRVSSAPPFAFPGQAAYAIGSGPAVLSTDARRVAPIASMAKVMTALVVLRAHPLEPGADGPALSVTADDVRDTDRRRDRDESLIEVAEGEQLTERQMLVALLLPSANNVAVMVTRLVSPSVDAFVALMNRTAHTLGMTGTRYTDPSGFDESTVSTALDQVRLARTAGANRELAAVAALEQYSLPVAGTVRNTDTLLGDGTFLGLKTGSHDAAGGCFLFHARTRVHGRLVDVWGVVMGQRGHDLIGAALSAARRLVASISVP